jgi:hypothetical protein
VKAALLSLLALLSCAHVAGTKCDAGAAFCTSATATLACQNGVLVPFACPGPNGCTRHGDRVVHCDQSEGVAPGAACSPEYEGHGNCLGDKTGRLTCKGGLWELSICAVGTRCTDNGDAFCK